MKLFGYGISISRKRCQRKEHTTLFFYNLQAFFVKEITRREIGERILLTDYWKKTHQKKIPVIAASFGQTAQTSCRLIEGLETVTLHSGPEGSNYQQRRAECH
jgi:hypothetical protein